MSAFSQHDEMEPLPEGDTTVSGPCQLCDHEAHVRVTGPLVEGEYQILSEEGAPLFLCERCWWIAWRGAKPVNIDITGGIHTLFAAAKA